MRYFAMIPLGLLLLSSCSGPDAEAEPDYENMVMIDSDDDEAKRDIALIEPQEMLLIENGD